MTNSSPLKYKTPDELVKDLLSFGKNIRVTRGAFNYSCEGKVQDMDWNHMDQLHRPYIHKTYLKNVRIALGHNFALSLMRWGRWPFFITVSDIYIKEGLFYQNLTLCGLIFIHNIMHWTQQGELAHLNMQWIISSHWLLKPLHRTLDRKFTRLNIRLQKEDAFIRNQRNALRKTGYAFTSDPVNYYTSNMLHNHTIYPRLEDNAAIFIENIKEQCSVHHFGALSFITKLQDNHILLWPGICPHEGAELITGTLRDDCKITCPWHGLNFTPVKLSLKHPTASMYGFNYALKDTAIHISQSAQN